MQDKARQQRVNARLRKQREATVARQRRRADAVRRPLRPFWRAFWLRFTYVTSVLVKKY